MSETDRIAELLQQAYQGEAGCDDGWHGPSLHKLLDDVTAEKAWLRSIPTGHDIWELVLRIAAWDEICARRLRGEVMIHGTLHHDLDHAGQIAVLRRA